MPISGASSFIPTLNDFLPHWEQVNTALGGAGPLVLRNPSGPTPPTLDRAALVTLRDDLSAKHTDITGQINNVEIASAELKVQKEALHLRGAQFNDAVRSGLDGTTYATALPMLPSTGDGQGVFVEPMDDVSTLWAKINVVAGIPGFTPPLLLLGGYPLADFNTALGLLKTQFETTRKEEFLVTFKISERNKLQNLIYPALKAYRVAVPTKFAANDPLVLTLPRLSPEPGSTPDAVNATGVWNIPTTQGKITWDASTAGDLAQYEVRWSPGSSYNSADEVVLGNFAPTDPREFFTLQGLGAAGAVSVFKVYVITTTGNEKGSNVAKITRP